MNLRETRTSKILEGYGLMLAMIIGAGIFGLPYSFSKAPLHWNLFLFATVFFLSWLMHYLYAGIIYATPGKHRFPGYVKKYLGHRAETIAAIFTVLSAYGAMLAYGILGALFLENIFGLDFLLGGAIFFVLGGVLFSMSLNSVGKVNFYLTIPLLVFMLALAARLFPAIDAGNFIAANSQTSWFFSYGILVFALGGYGALPDIHDLLGHTGHSIFKRIIFWSLFGSALLYLIFIFAVMGASGTISEDAISGLNGVLGREAMIIGSLIGIFTVFRAYAIFGADLKLTFEYDYGISKTSAWLLAFIPPIGLFLSGVIDLVKILSIVGSVGLGVFAVFILMMSARKKKEISSFVGFEPKEWMLLVLGALFIFGALADLIGIFGI